MPFYKGVFFPNGLPVPAPVKERGLHRTANSINLHLLRGTHGEEYTEEQKKCQSRIQSFASDINTGVIKKEGVDKIGTVDTFDEAQRAPLNSKFMEDYLDHYLGTSYFDNHPGVAEERRAVADQIKTEYTKLRG